MSNNIGNRITDNAFNADGGKALIDSALAYIEKRHGWRPTSEKALFSGVYYDSQKVGSYIIRVENALKKTAVLKIQLHPLPFDEGFIIRHIDRHNKSEKIKTVKIIDDLAWDKELGFGYLLFEDISSMDDLWRGSVATDKDRALHKTFLDEFINKVLPIQPWMDVPRDDLKSIYKNAFEHFYGIAEKSGYQHIDKDTLEKCKKTYFEIMDKMKFEQIHFTHGHLSGKDVKCDENTGNFYLMASLYWSYRPKYHELTFPIWVDLMSIRNADLELDDMLNVINAWNKEWQAGVFDHDPAETAQYWFNLLERAMLTIMLDLGASEWTPNEKMEKAALLSVWVGLFNWIAKNKFNYN